MKQQTSPTMQEWKRLYEAHAAIKELAPWNFMEEVEIFGVQHPESGDVGFVSVMGNLGEHLAVSAYLGDESLYQFWELHEAGPFLRAEAVLETPHLQASFEDREMLEKEDRAVIQALGRKYRGRQAWPLFRSFQPGYAPWFLSPAEVRFLALVLEQTLDVARRLERNPHLLDAVDGETYLVRVPEGNGRLAWRDEQRSYPPPEAEQLEMSIPTGVLQAYQKLKKMRHGVVEVDLFLLPGVIREKDSLPYFAYAMMIVEPRSGMVLANEILDPRPSLHDMRNEAFKALLTYLVRAKLRPGVIATSSIELSDRLAALQTDMGAELLYEPILPTLEEVKEQLFAFLQR
jgi:hypothetical protein